MLTNVMEVRVYSTLETFQASKPLYVRKFDVFPDLVVDYPGILKVMRTLYGNNVVVVFVCL